MQTTVSYDISNLFSIHHHQSSVHKEIGSSKEIMCQPQKRVKVSNKLWNKI